MPCTSPSWILYSLPCIFPRPFCYVKVIWILSLSCNVLWFFLPTFLLFAWPVGIFLHSITLCVCRYPCTCMKKENWKSVNSVYLMLVYVLETEWSHRCHLSDNAALHHFLSLTKMDHTWGNQHIDFDQYWLS